MIPRHAHTFKDPGLDDSDLLIANENKEPLPGSLSASIQLPSDPHHFTPADTNSSYHYSRRFRGK